MPATARSIAFRGMSDPTKGTLSKEQWDKLKCASVLDVDGISHPFLSLISGRDEATIVVWIRNYA